MKIKSIKKVIGKKLDGGSLPDIDSDFASDDREIIKRYMEKRFGEEQVVSVGTLMTLQPKGIIKDIARINSIDFQKVNLITSIINDKEDHDLLDILKRASKENKLKDFIMQNYDIFYMMPELIGQPRGKGIHACATIIFPDVMKAIEWAPMRMEGDILISEWDGKELGKAGFLKEDILAIKQLSKFTDILDLIKKNDKKVPDLHNLPNDPDVFVYFSNGWNGDIFQMGSPGLTKYTQHLKPEVIGDIIAANALYRPGPMNNHYHEIYVQCKNNGRKQKYLWGTEDICKSTYGLIVYQEQVMRIFQELGGLSLKEADDVRRAIGDKNIELMKTFKDTIWKGYKENGSTKEQFEESWDAIVEFAHYSFNLSHSTAYGLTGYAGQYLKLHYPIEFWTVALQYAADDKATIYLSEILQAKKISVSPPDINGSEIEMTSNQETSTIFWGIESIKGIGEVAAEQIVELRKEGDYKNFQDFYIRNKFKGSKVRKQNYEGLIACGAFDKLHNIKEGEEYKRLELLIEYRTVGKVKIAKPERDIYTTGDVNKSYWWLLTQKSLTGLAFLDYRKIAEPLTSNPYCDNITLITPQRGRLGKSVAFGGFVTMYRENRSKNGKFARLTIENNYKMYNIIIWNEAYEEHEHILKKCLNSLIIFDGVLKYEEKYTEGNQFTIIPGSNLTILK